ncbi:MAG TPA: hypothetical protein VGJ06_14025 [Candidatus Acidoferrum sp.]|jgi:hypothetical protein
MNREETLREMVLKSVANDWESFALIEEQIQKWANEAEIEVTADEMARHLTDLIRDGLVKAYVLSPQAPHSVVAEFSPVRLDELWYLVTPEGLTVVKALEG